MKKTILKLFTFFLIIILPMPSVSAQSIPITQSSSMDKVIFDGKWTFPQEWKQSSYDEIQTESEIIPLRTAHQGNFIYILIDVVTDNTIDNNEDSTLVCFDAKNEKNTIPDENDFCFMIKLDSDKVVTFQGKQSEGFQIVQNHDSLIGIGGISDENDRYSKLPHGVYEFRIPIELLERSEQYGFYAHVFDFTESATYTWPSEIDMESSSDIPSPDSWGIIYSPDKSLPEYDLPILILIIGTFSMILLTSKSKKLNLFSTYR